MTTEISDIKTRLAAIAETVPDIKRAYANAPALLPESDMPIVCAFVGPEVRSGAGNPAEFTRTFLLRLYVVPVQAGYDGEAERRVEPFLMSVRDVFLSHPRLGLGTAQSALAFVRRAEWLGDGGVAVLPYARQQYLGAEFRLNVSMIVPIQYAKFE
jgi:hypothetical protein